MRRGKLFRRDRELFVCYGEDAVGKQAAANAERLGGGQGAVAAARAGCNARGLRVPPTVASPLIFDAYARQLTFDAWEPDRRAVMRRAQLNDSLPFDSGQEKGATLANFKGSYLGRFSLVSADVSTSDHLSERSRT